MQKVAILFVALGQESAGEVMKYLSEYEIEDHAVRGPDVGLFDRRPLH